MPVDERTPEDVDLMFARKQFIAGDGTREQRAECAMLIYRSLTEEEKRRLDLL